MIDRIHLYRPVALAHIEETTKALGFNMASDMLTGSLLRTLAASKSGGMFLELGTGTGMGTAWILDGMDTASRLITMDHDERVVSVARQALGSDPRVTFHVMEGMAFIQSLTVQGIRFDFIFADTFPGKYNALDETLALLKLGGLYVIDDMLPQPNWPDGHAVKVTGLIETLEGRPDLRLTKLNWSTGLIVAAKAKK